MSSKIERVRGVVESVVFYAPETGFSVVELLGDTHFTAIGSMPKLSVGEEVHLTGTWRQHDIYGKQFAVQTVEQHLPTEKNAILRYLESGAIKGIGPVLALRIIESFGEKALDMIEKKPEKLAGVKGITRAMAKRFQAELKARSEDQELALLLLPAGITYRRIIKIKDVLGLGAKEAIKDDPWILARKISGIGFETCDKIATSLGFVGDHVKRLVGAAVHAIYEELTLGHTWTPLEQLVAKTGKRLDVSERSVEEALEPLPQEVLKQEIDGEIAISFLDTAEIEAMTAARMERALSPSQKKAGLLSREAIAACASRLGLELADEQADAVAMAVREPFSVITGGPGTGKTTIIRVLVTLAEQSGQTIQLAAPTGRAARRMLEATGRPAQTLHRLLNITPDEDDMPEAISAKETLKTDLVIVDEASMIDLYLFARLLFALSPKTRLLLVGDADQLPSIGPGQILTDLLFVDFIPRTRLTRIYRQDASNLIVLNAHRLNHGEALEFTQTLESPFMFINRERDSDIPDAVLQLVERILPDYYGVKNPRDVQILAPMRRGAAGIHNLNATIQAYWQKDAIGGGGLVDGDRTFYVGDRVIQTKNNYDLEWRSESFGSGGGSGIMNGEVGIITTVDKKEKSLTVLFEDERLAEIGKEELDDLELAYAVTIHKSQGSEYQVVILALGMGPPDFMTRNLVYTAFTRAKKLLIVVSRRSTLEFVRKNKKIGQRRTLFAHLLRRTVEI